MNNDCEHIFRMYMHFVVETKVYTYVSHVLWMVHLQVTFQIRYGDFRRSSKKRICNLHMRLSLNTVSGERIQAPVFDFTQPLRMHFAILWCAFMSDADVVSKFGYYQMHQIRSSQKVAPRWSRRRAVSKATNAILCWWQVTFSCVFHDFIMCVHVLGQFGVRIRIFLHAPKPVVDRRCQKRQMLFFADSR